MQRFALEKPITAYDSTVVVWFAEKLELDVELQVPWIVRRSQINEKRSDRKSRGMFIYTFFSVDSRIFSY